MTQEPQVPMQFCLNSYSLAYDIGGFTITLGQTRPVFNGAEFQAKGHTDWFASFYASPARLVGLRDSLTQMIEHYERVHGPIVMPRVPAAEEKVTPFRPRVFEGGLFDSDRFGQMADPISVGEAAYFGGLSPLAQNSDASSKSSDAPLPSSPTSFTGEPPFAPLF